MLTDSRFIEGNTSLKKTVDTLATKNAFNDNNGESILSDYRGINVFSSYEMFELMGIKWVIVAEIDEDEVITEHYKKYQKYFQQEIIQYLAQQPVVKKSKSHDIHSLKQVDLNEFFKADKNKKLITFGVSICTSIAISYPDKFSYLAHITPTDEIYIESILTKWLVGAHYQNLLTQLLDQITYYDIYPYELKQLEIIIAAPHDKSFNKAIDILLERQIELSKIKIIYLPNAKSINVAIKNTGKTVDVTMTNENYIVDIKTSEIEDLGTILKKIIRYDKKPV